MAKLLYNFIIKKVSDEIVKPLTCILNLLLSTGNIPENLKVAKIILTSHSSLLTRLCRSTAGCSPLHDFAAIVYL